MTKTIKYGYCVNENNELVHISSITIETRHSYKLYCLQCGMEMVPKLGNDRAKHFAHKQECACNGESYLHKLAKRMIRDKFLSSETFPIVFDRLCYCSEKDNCRFFSSEWCQRPTRVKRDLKKWDGKVVYDTCEEEVSDGDYRPDLLLTCSTKPERKHVFIEIFKTHQSEESKINSGYKVIETIKIETEEEIKNIIENGFIEKKNCSTFSFEPKIPAKKITSGAPVKRFIMQSNGIVRIPRYDWVRCDQLNRKIDSKSLIELNIIDDSRYKGSENLDMETLKESFDIMTYFRKGLTYLIKCKGIEIKNCMLCYYYNYNDSHGKYICILYKKLNLSSSHPEQNKAQNCPCYKKDQENMNFPLYKLEHDVSEVIEKNLNIHK